MSRFVGVTVLPEYLQYEGVESVLDNLVERAGVTAVATSPYVLAVADEDTGSREPPIDAGAGAVRQLDRPLWGQRELWVRTAPSFSPDKSLYHGLRYQPAEPDELTAAEGTVIQRFIAAAHERNLQVYFQVMAAIPPGYRVQFGGPTEDDTPRLPDGSIPARRVAKNGSLASGHIVDYQHAFIRDLLRQYPAIDGIRFDWPEYPPYLIDSAFVDFGGHAKAAARRLGFDFQTMSGDAQKLYDFLHGGLTDDGLLKFLTEEGGRPSFLDLVPQYPGVAEAMKFKAQLSSELLAGFRQVMNDAGGADVKMAPSAFPPTWSLVSGIDFEQLATHCQSVAVKLYGMHWAMMLHFYGEQLLAANPGLSSRLLVKALVRLLDIADDEGHSTLDDYKYPGPNDAHPVGHAAQIRKIAEAQEQAGSLPVHAFAHGYGPLSDFQRRIQTAVQSSAHGIWVNRYCYLSDEKLDAIGSAVRNVSR